MLERGVDVGEREWMLERGGVDVGERGVDVREG